MELSPISSFDDDTEQARSAAEQYPNALAQCLALSDWSFASQLAMLPAAALPVNNVTDPDLPYFFQAPSDMIRMREVGDACTVWRLDRDGLRTDSPGPIRIRYTATVTNEAILPASFQTAVALKLALLLGPRWLGTQSKLADLSRRFEMEIATAKKNDARSASAVRYDAGAGAGGDWSNHSTW
ncbi:hypothetical protein [Rhodoferax sp.]|uniref:hypothetical protein n=1 Tax=Rhodoferax sp. TaxID=50421 RepID=UPI002ACECCDA|nr:hypothetical protein [Rhodoferax sp.]MDZ7919982.1 hypothetical protein [Rhodoferax sp.]